MQSLTSVRRQCRDPHFRRVSPKDQPRMHSAIDPQATVSHGNRSTMSSLRQQHCIGARRSVSGHSGQKCLELSKLLHSKEAPCQPRGAIWAVRAGFASDREKEDWMRRQRESGGGGAAPTGGSWNWTLNWSPIVPGILVGSCPRSPQDLDRIADEGGATALINLQSNDCFDALKIPIDAIKERSVERGVCLQRVPIRDFDHGDQSFMLPQAVRLVNQLLTKGHIVYIHCTAGINRASLTALGYLTFVQGMELDAAMHILKTARPIVHPYLDCWYTVRNRLLSGRDEELVAVAREIYQKRSKDNGAGDSGSDWRQAQATVISRVFQQYLTVDLAKLEADGDSWRHQKEEWDQERKKAAAEAEEAALAEMAACSKEGQSLEAELSLLSLQASSRELQLLLASSRALRLECEAKPVVTVEFGELVKGLKAGELLRAKRWEEEASEEREPVAV